MSIEHIILGAAIVFFLACFVFVMWPKPAIVNTAVSAGASVVASGASQAATAGANQAVAFFQYLEAQGKIVAAQQLAALMAAQYAAQHAATLQSAMAAAAAAPAPTVPNFPTAPPVVVVAPQSPSSATPIIQP
jgi:hypothetical protein